MRGRRQTIHLSWNKNGRLFIGTHAQSNISPYWFAKEEERPLVSINGKCHYESENI